MCVPLAFLTDGIGTGEMLLVLAVALLLFGPRKIPGIARSLGRAVNEMRRASREFQDQIMRMEEPPSREGGSAVPVLPPDAGKPAAGAGSNAEDDEPGHVTHNTRPDDNRPEDAGGHGLAGR